VLPGGLLGTFVIANFGMDGSGVMRRADLDALRYFEAHSPAGSDLLNLGLSDLPSSPPTLELTDHLVAYQTIGEGRAQQPGHPTRSDLATLLTSYEQDARKLGGGRVGELYAVWSPVSATYAKEYGLELESQAERWPHLVLGSGDWRVEYQEDGSYLFRATVPPAQRRAGR
jgi:hypothetical protein